MTLNVNDYTLSGKREDLIVISDKKGKYAAVIRKAKTEACPTATGDIKVNLKNRKTAIDSAMYGPLNPSEPNEDYWKKLGDEWDVTPADAKKQRCGNCAAFIQTPEMKECISAGLTGGERKDEFDSIDEAGELGYCEIFDFKCAAARTCRAWITGGPVK
jgi:hypothetical protein